MLVRLVGGTVVLAELTALLSPVHSNFVVAAFDLIIINLFYLFLATRRPARSCRALQCLDPFLAVAVGGEGRHVTATCLAAVLSTHLAFHGLQHWQEKGFLRFFRRRDVVLGQNLLLLLLRVLVHLIVLLSRVSSVKLQLGN